MFGGLGTLGLINLFVPMCNGRGKQIIFGLAEKWLRMSATLGWDKIPNEWKNGEPKEPTTIRYIQRYSPTIFAYQLTEELKNSSADILFDCMAVDPIMEENICKGVITEEVTDYIVRNHLLIFEKLKKTDRKTREIVTSPDMPQFRTTCHIKGDYSLKIDDAFRHFDDSICTINDFEHCDHLFEIPLRTLTRHDFPNIITAGRSADGTGYGWDLIRVIPPAILTGQAAGEAACLAIKTNTAIANVDIRTLQAKLEKENVMIHFPDSYVPKNKTVIIHEKNASEIDGGHM